MHEMNEKKINEYLKAQLGLISGFTNQVNAEKELYRLVTEKLNETLPRFTPDRENIINVAGDAMISNFRVGVEWYKNNTPADIDK